MSAPLSYEERVRRDQTPAELVHLHGRLTPEDERLLAQQIAKPAITREPQYAACFQEKPVTMGAMIGATWLWNPRRLGFVLARYKFVAQMLKGRWRVAEIGCSDGFASRVVSDAVARLDLYDFDEVWVREAERIHPGRVKQWDITQGPLWKATPGVHYDGVYMLDVFEHIAVDKEDLALRAICDSLTAEAVFICGIPSLESQAYAAPISKAGHVNCKSGEDFRATMAKHFRNVFLFGMNDEMVHVGFPPMCHYLLAVCTGPAKDNHLRYYAPGRDPDDVTNGNGDG